MDCSDLNNFDLVIDTTIPGVEEISKLIRQLFEEFSDKATINKYWVSTMTLYPTEHVRKPEQVEAKKVRQSISEIGYDKSNVVETVKFGRDLFIRNGHKRVSASIFNKIPLIPIVILAKDDEEIHSGNTVSDFIKASFNQTWFYDWEKVHGFKFESYPKV